MAGDVVYARDQLSGIYAYPARCRADGGICDPAWVAPLGRIFGTSPLVAVDDLVFTGTAGGHVYAFPATCSTPCRPLWQGRAGGKGAGITVSGDRVFALSRGLVSYSLSPRSASNEAPSGLPELVFYGVVALIALGLLAVRLRHRRQI